MAVTIQKPQVVPAPVKDALAPAKNTTLTEAEIAAVDKLVALEKILAPHREAIKEFEKTKKYLASVAADERFDKALPAVLHGTTGSVTFSDKGETREVSDMNAAIQTLKTKVGGYEQLLPLLSISFKNLDTYLTPAEQKAFVGMVPGSRTLKAVVGKE